MEAEELLEPLRERNGVSESAFEDALEATLAEHEREEDIYLATLSRFVEALGGRLEVRAVFPGATVELGS